MGKKGNRNERRNESPLEVLVHTTLGDVRMRTDEEVYVVFAPGRYGICSVGSLLPGDRVLYDRRYIRKTLPELEPALRTNRRYADAEDALFIIQGEQRTPRWGYDLRSYVGEQCTIFDFGQRVLQSQEITSHEYTASIEFLRGALNTTPLHVPADSTMRKWLSGETVLTRYREIPRLLAQKDGRFAKYDEQMYLLHSKYSVIRQNIMRYLAEEREGAESSSRSEAQGSLEESLLREIELIVSEFMGTLDRETRIARITNIELARGADPEKNTPASSPLRSKRADQETYKGQTIAEKEIMMDFTILHHAVTWFLFHALKKRDTPYYAAIGSRTEPYIVSGDVRDVLLGMLYPESKNLQILRQRSSAALVGGGCADVETAVGQIYNAIYTGEFDKVYTLQKGSTLEQGSTLRALHTLARVGAHAHGGFFTDLQKIDAEQKRVGNISKLRKLPRSSLPSRTYFTELATYYYFRADRHHLLRDKPLAEWISDRAFMNLVYGLSVKATNHGRELIGETETRVTLERYNLGFMHRYIPQTVFIHEQQGL